MTISVKCVASFAVSSNCVWKTYSDVVPPENSRRDMVCCLYILVFLVSDDVV